MANTGPDGLDAVAEEAQRMQPLPYHAGKARSQPEAVAAVPPEDETPSSPVDDDSDEQSWESLGLTRVTEGATPPVQSRPYVDRTETEDYQRAVQSNIAKEPTNLGDFTLVRQIGEGAMGKVYKARQLSFDRDVALKILFPHIAKNPKLLKRLEREGNVMFQLDHPNIVQAYGIDEYQGWHYIAMEFIDGHNMQKWLAEIGRLSIGDALRIIIDCARALEYAHNQGIVHRDIKPDNILITAKGVVKVADLGMVKKADDEDEMALTQTGHAVGTPWYMPLEQAKNAKDTDRRSDIYALGCMLYCFLTGMPPFAGKTLLEVIHAKETGTFPPARQGNPEVPERLDMIMVKMTAKLPKYRYQTCAELVNDLEGLQLASPELTFLGGKSAAAKEAPPRPPSSHDDTDPVVIVEPNIWYVRVKTTDGRTAVQRLTTALVQKMLDEDKLAPNVKASRGPKAGFRALATYKEFQGQAFVKASKMSADQQTVRYRTLYKKIEQQADEREREKESVPPEPDFPPWLPLAIKIGASALGAILVLLFFWSLLR